PPVPIAQKTGGGKPARSPRPPRSSAVAARPPRLAAVMARSGPVPLAGFPAVSAAARIAAAGPPAGGRPTGHLDVEPPFLGADRLFRRQLDMDVGFLAGQQLQRRRQQLHAVVLLE